VGLCKLISCVDTIGDQEDLVATRSGTKEVDILCAQVGGGLPLLVSSMSEIDRHLEYLGSSGV